MRTNHNADIKNYQSTIMKRLPSSNPLVRSQKGIRQRNIYNKKPGIVVHSVQLRQQTTSRINLLNMLVKWRGTQYRYQFHKRVSVEGELQTTII